MQPELSLLVQISGSVYQNLQQTSEKYRNSISSTKIYYMPINLMQLDQQFTKAPSRPMV